MLGEPGGDITDAASDPHCLGLLKHYHSLVPLAQEARKPLFLLRSADGAIGAHQQAVQAVYAHFGQLANSIMSAIGVTLEAVRNS